MFFRQTDNDLDGALIALDDNIETLLFILTNEEVTPDKITFVTENGFTEEASRKALVISKGDVEQAIVALTQEQVSTYSHPSCAESVGVLKLYLVWQFRTTFRSLVW